MSTSTRWWARIFRARSSTEPTISPMSCRAVLGLIEPDSSLVMSSRLAMKRLSRSDSSRMVATRSALALSSRAPDKSLSVPAAPTMAASGVFRSCEMRGEQRRAQAIGLDPALGLIEIVHEMDALDGQRRLVDQGVKQAPLVGREQRTRLVAVDADDADGAAAGAHGQEQPLGAGQRIGAAPGRAIVLPGPFRRGDIGLIENVLRRIARLDGNGAVLGQQQDDADFQHQGRLVGASPKARRRACRRRRACG